MRSTLLALLVLGLPALAQDGAPPTALSLSRESGLASNTVYAVLQDQHGFLWLGTDAGLSRYDGYAVQTYAHVPFEDDALPANLVRALAEGPDGEIWVGTSAGGLSRLDPETGRFTHFRHDPDDPTSLSDDHVSVLHVDRRGTLWAGTWGGTLNRLDAATGRFVRYDVDGDHPSRTIRAIVEDEDGTLWVGGFTGLFRYRLGEEAPRRVFPRSGNTMVTALALDDAGTLWATIPGRGLLAIDRSTLRAEEFYPHPDPQRRRSFLHTLAIDDSGAAWVGTRGGGLLRFDPDARAFAPVSPGTPGGPPATAVTALFVDRAGAVWAGFRGLGVFRVRPQTLQVQTYAYVPDDPSSLGPSLVLGIEEDRYGDVWVGTMSGGLSRLDPTTGEARRYMPDGSPRSLTHHTVWDVHEARDGTLWVATTVAINRYDRERDRFERLGLSPRGEPAHGIPHVNTYTLYETRDGTMWAGTWGGLGRYDAYAGRFVAYRHDPDDPTSLSRNQVWAIEEDRRGALWLGTDGGGLNRLDRATGRFAHFRHDPDDPASLAHDRVHDVHEGADGSIWVATSGGLSRLDPEAGTFRHLTTREGLPSNLVRGLHEDEAGGLWVVTAGGLAYHDPRTGRVRIHGRHDGFPASSYSHVALEWTADGRLWVGSDVGVTAFRPDAVVPDTVAPPVAFTDLRVAGVSVTEHRPTAVREVRLGPDDDFVTFEFAALAFSAPQHLRYAYRLEGLETSWTDSGPRREATYAHLAPGTYTFRIRAAGPSGVWNEEGASVRVVVEPALWERAPVQAAAALLFLGLLGGGYRWRLHHLLRVERTRTRIADDLHDDLGSQVSTVALMVELGSRSPALPEAERTRLRDAAAMARRLVDDIRDTVWVIDAGHDGLGTLVERLEQTAHQMLQGMSHRLVLPDAVPEVDLSLQTRRHVLLLLKEALHNVLRHAEASHVEVEVGVVEGRLTLLVRDDGTGFDVAAAGAGRGLGLMRDRARRLEGALEIESRPGGGTALRLVVPLD